MTDLLRIEGLTNGASDERLREEARRIYAKGSDDDIEIDDAAEVSRGDEGAWVAAWVWLRFDTEEEVEG